LWEMLLNSRAQFLKSFTIHNTFENFRNKTSSGVDRVEHVQKLPAFILCQKCIEPYIDNLKACMNEFKLLGVNKHFFKHFDKVQENFLEQWIFQRSQELHKLISICLSQWNPSILPSNPPRNPSLMLLEICSDMIQQFNALVPSPMLELDVHDLFLPFYFEIHIPLEIQGVKVT
jgi:hypothetical protein